MVNLRILMFIDFGCISTGAVENLNLFGVGVDAMFCCGWPWQISFSTQLEAFFQHISSEEAEP